MEKFDRERIEQELEKLPREQAVQFVWRCGMRALPFLGANANFDFWDVENRQKHLDAVFHALDFAAAAASYAAATAHAAAASYADAASHAFSASAAATSASASAAAASAATSAYATTTAAASSASAATAAAAATAAYAASAAYAAFADADAAYASDAASATAAFAASYAAASKSDKGQEMIAAIWHDLEAAQGKTTLPLSVDLYGGVWENFQQALAAEGCVWWGRLYQQIFDDALVLSYEALERRLNIPEEIRERGAAEVGKYLEDLEKENARRYPGRQAGGEDAPGA